MDLLPVSVGVGLAVGLLFTEVFGIATGGLIVPGYMALYLTRPMDLAVTLVASFGAFALVRVVSSFAIVYGRRRTALVIMTGYLLGMLLSRWSLMEGVTLDVIGYVIPGLIALWMDRQGIVSTLSSMAIVTVFVRLILIVFVGTEALQ